MTSGAAGSKEGKGGDDGEGENGVLGGASVDGLGGDEGRG